MNGPLAARPMSLLMAFAACSTQSEPRPTAEDPQSARTAAVCLPEAPFVADGSIPVDTAGNGDPQQVSGLRWQAHQGCERFVIDLARDDGTPATAVGDIRAELLRPVGVIRVSLPGVTHVDADATHAEFGGTLGGGAYTVRSEDDRSLFVDLHLARPAEAHVTALADPARVVVDLRPGGEAVPPPPTTGERVVVLLPRPGDTRYPLTVTGYARLFEANVIARILKDGAEAARKITTATDWTETWGHFSLAFESGPTGAVELHVGDYSAKDGTWHGVIVPLTLR